MLAIKLANLTYVKAATIFLGGLKALHSLRKGNVQSGDKALIVGAGGRIGTYDKILFFYFENDPILTLKMYPPLPIVPKN